MPDSYAWWQHGIIYQIYPRSFMDGNGDGIGDLPGTTSRLDYLSWLGVDAIWISPIFRSPMADGGYDVSDYLDIDPLFGSRRDFDQLLGEAHRRGIRVVLDYVPNHTSDRHPWFVASRASRASRKRDWYVWGDAAPDGGAPNNWLSLFGGSAWEQDLSTGQYYLHTYLKEQPDLNWRNPEVEAAMLDVLRFWFDRGVDGFRIDALGDVIKDDRFRDNPPNPDWAPGDSAFKSLLPAYTADRPELMEVVHSLRSVADSYPDRVLIGELWLSIERLMAYYGRDGRGLHLPFNFQLINSEWSASSISALVDAYEAALPPGAWPNSVLGNHDRSRIASRVGQAQARVATMLLLTLRGTPTLYYGDEIGMHDVVVPPGAVNDYFEGRDPERTPMQWDAGPNAGFSTVTPWLPVADDYECFNVAGQSTDRRSMLALYRSLIKLRRATPALAVGRYRHLHTNADLFVYEREAGDERWRIALNLSNAPRTTALSGPRSRIVISTHLDRSNEPLIERLELRADEGVVIQVGVQE